MVNGNSKNETESMPDDRPYFFKIIHDGINNESLRIPPHFMKHISKDTSERAILKGPSGSNWQVKLRKSSGRIYLQDGWKKFLRDHSLGDNEFLLFRYDGNMCFNAQIFDKNGCERYDEFIMDNHKHQDANVPEVKRKRGRPRKYPLNVSSKEGTTRQIPCHISKERDTKKEIKTEETDRTVEEMNSQQEKNKEEKDTKRENKTEAHLEKVTEEIKTEEVEIPNQEMDFNSRQSFSKRDDATVVERPCELKIAGSFTSEHPFFRIRLRESHVHRIFILAIPIDFANSHLPKFKSKMVLKNSEGKAWEVNCFPSAGKYAFTGGWPAFVHANNLKEGDVCMFELLKAEEMMVHIFKHI